MEKAKQVGTSSTSFTCELFGPKDLSKSSSSTGHFAALFGPSSTGLGKDSTHSGTSRQHANNSANAKQESFGNKGQRNGSTGKDPNSVYQNGTVEPCNYFNSSSIYYGGQDVYSAQNPNSQHRKDSGEDDSNGNNATRGNWWQGSLYY